MVERKILLVTSGSGSGKELRKGPARFPWERRESKNLIGAFGFGKEEDILRSLQESLENAHNLFSQGRERNGGSLGTFKGALDRVISFDQAFFIPAGDDLPENRYFR